MMALKWINCGINYNNGNTENRKKIKEKNSTTYYIIILIYLTPESQIILQKKDNVSYILNGNDQNQLY